MQNSHRAIILLLVAGILVCACMATFGTAGIVAWQVMDDTEQQADAPPSPPEEQDTGSEAIPDFSVTDLDGRDWTLDDLKGRPVVINFWATWCPPCREELPTLQELADEYADEGLVILLVDVQESESLVRDYLDARSVDLPCVIDGTGQLSRRFRVNSFPTNVLIRPDGTSGGRIVGWQGKEHLRRGIEFIIR